jgi:hypothetical protein
VEALGKSRSGAAPLRANEPAMLESDQAGVDSSNVQLESAIRNTLETFGDGVPVERSERGEGWRTMRSSVPRRTSALSRMVKKSVLIENKGDPLSPHSVVNLTLRSGLLVS